MRGMLTTPDPAFALALGLSALLAFRNSKSRSWEQPERLARFCRCLPWLLLLVFGTAATLFGILHPEEFAALADPDMNGANIFVTTASRL